MIPPATPRNESARLEALRSLQILDTDAEDDYNRLVDFVARMCEVPICLVSLVDAERQWFKARHGLEVCQTGRDVSLCGHAILEDASSKSPTPTWTPAATATRWCTARRTSASTPAHPSATSTVWRWARCA